MFQVVVLFLINLVVALFFALLVDWAHANAYVLTTVVGSTILVVQAILALLLLVVFLYALRDELK
jgi:hypothetical protein